jgi:hypothetical protein
VGIHQLDLLDLDLTGRPKPSLKEPAPHHRRVRRHVRHPQGDQSKRAGMSVTALAGWPTLTFSFRALRTLLSRHLPTAMIYLPVKTYRSQSPRRGSTFFHVNFISRALPASADIYPVFPPPTTRRNRPSSPRHPFPWGQTLQRTPLRPTLGPPGTIRPAP